MRTHRHQALPSGGTTLALNDDLQLQALRLLQANLALSQRGLAEALGISLGKANYCIKALLDKGWVKARNFKNSKHKLAYASVLTQAASTPRHASPPASSSARWPNTRPSRRKSSS